MKDIVPTEKISFVRPPEFPGCEIIRFDHTSQLIRCYHQNYMINMNFTGGDTPRWGKGSYRGKATTVTDDDMVIAEPGELQVTTFLSGPVCFRTLFINLETFKKAAGDMGITGSIPHFKIHVTSAPRLYTAFKNLHQSLESTSTTLELQSRWTHGLRIFFETASEKAPPPYEKGSERKAIRRAIELMREKSTQDLTLNNLSEAARLSPFHFLREFTREVGLPPHTYQIQLRLEKARQLLLAGLPAVETALHAGFYDQSHMIRHFKKNYGFTPAQYADQNR